MSSVQMKYPRVFPLSENCILIQFEDVISEEVHRDVMELSKSFSASPLPFLNDIVPAYSSIALFFDSLKHTSASFCFEDTIATIRTRLDSLKNPRRKHESGRIITVPTRFGGAFGKDLREIVKLKGIGESALIDLFCQETYKVFLIGFRPGFPYMGTVPDELAVERLATPRANVHAGSVGIAGRQTGIYPMDSPGGWRLIGRSELKLLDIDNEANPTYFQPGDMVRFIPI